ncbi:MAG TPA: hypothetical protein PLU30_18600 [Verrucomicrobiae bacterium]|nr:hypothetical protein [Verrucomicrobiae bacterium]
MRIFQSQPVSSVRDGGRIRRAADFSRLSSPAARQGRPAYRIPILRLVALSMFLQGQCPARSAETPDPAPSSQARTAWFRDAKWGVFFHYLASPASATEAADMDTERWNRRIDAFDVAGLARQLEEIRAGYFFITLGQNSGFYLSPNGTYDRLVGRAPGRCSRRDLVADIAAALKPHGIRTMVYFTSMAPAQDRQAIERLRCTPPWDPRRVGFKPDSFTPQPGVDERLTEFQRNWEAVIREWSLRWGKDVHGWWIDGAYNADVMYRHKDPPNFQSFADAMRAGNPDAIVCFNPGVKVPVIKHAPCEDYTAGEIADAFPVGVDAGKWAKPVGGTVAGAQYHVLTFLGDYWGRGKPRFPAEMLLAYTKYLNDRGGVITWDVPPAENGHIPDNFFQLLLTLKEGTRE